MVITFNHCYLKLNEKNILDDFSLTINQGDKVLITGKSGTGKSTLLNILLGFTPLDKGEILYHSKPLKGSDFKSFRRNCAYVNQDVTLRSGTVKEILEDISQFSYNVLNPTLSQETIDFLEFEPQLFHQAIEDLSGGERQRLGLLIAFALKRPIYLLDEITSALDHDLKVKVVNYLLDIEATVIIVSHDQEWLEVQHAHRVKKVVLS